MTDDRATTTSNWRPMRSPLRPGGVIVAFVILVFSVLAAAAIAPGVELSSNAAAIAVAIAIAALNAVLPPILAAIPLPYAFLLGFLGILLLNGVIFYLAGQLLPDEIHVASVWAGLLAALILAAVSITLSMLVGADDQAVALAVVKRVARRQGIIESGDVPGIIYLEIDGLAAPVLRRAIASGHAPNFARWLEEDGYELVEWEPDLSSQTGASQAGILLGSNEDIPAFRWVEKERARLVTCSAPDDCVLIEQRRSEGNLGLLAEGGASRGNLLSGGADEVILTVSRIAAEKGRNPGYRAFLASGANAARAFVLFGWELVLERVAAARQARRDVRPRGHRGSPYPVLRATMCVLVRELVYFGVLTDMMRGREAVYATFASYDEVAHHSGLERPDTLEALRKLDERFGRVARARVHAPRPYEIVVLSDHGQTQGATFKQRNGYTLEELVSRALAKRSVRAVPGGDEQAAMASLAVAEATGRKPKKRDKADVSGRDVVVLGSGNLGLIYLMDEPRRLELEEIRERHPGLVEALVGHEHVGWVLARSKADGAVVLGARGTLRLRDGHLEGEDPLAPFGPTAAQHLERANGFEHAADLTVGSFYDPALEEGCAFEELISFHGGLGGPQTQPFVLYPARSLSAPKLPLTGARAVHELLWAWRRELREPAAVEAAADFVIRSGVSPQTGRSVQP